MEKRNLYIIVAVVLVAAIVLSLGNFTGRAVGDCMDSDGGEDPLTPGSVSFSVSEAVYKDECYGSGLNPKKFVREYYCLDEAESRRYTCDAGCAENANGEGYCLPGEVSVLHNN